MAARSSFEPDAVAAATFPVNRRGYDADEVRSYLRSLADEMARLRRERDELRAELTRPRDVAPLDPAAVATALGEEAARVLTTARDAAAQIRAKSEEAAASLVDDANSEALRVREQADLDAARLREQAQADADAELEDAKAQGREMVAEARAVRERMMADVQRRKEQARAQLEQLRLGHERVLGTFELASDALASITGELRALAPDVRRTSTIDSGPVAIVPMHDSDVARAPVPPTVQVSVPDRPATPDVEPDGIYDGDDEPAGHVTAFALGEVAATSAPVSAPTPAPTVGREPVLEPELVLDAEPPEVEPAEAEPAEAELADEAARIDDAAPRDIVAADADAIVAPADPEPGHTLPSADDLFARIRAARSAVTYEATPQAAAEPSGASTRTAVLLAPSADDVAETFVARDATLAPVEAAVARRMKRALADEQNEVLDRLRRKNPVLTLDGLVGSAEDHALAYQRVVREELRSALVAGARSLRPELDDDECLRLAGGDVVERLATDARDELVAPLRERLERLLDRSGDASTVTDGVRTLYREWKTQKLDEIARHLVVAAHGRAAYAVLARGTPVCWVVDPGHPCPDGEDNALGGPNPAGEPFPTGHHAAPAYVGCRCALAPTAR